MKNLVKRCDIDTKKTRETKKYGKWKIAKKTEEIS